QRRAANELAHQSHRPGDPHLPAVPADGQEQAKDDGDQKAHQSDAQGLERSLQQVGQDLRDVVPVPDVHDRLPRRRPRPRRRSTARMVKLMTCARTKYSSRVRLKISRVWKVAWSSWRARKLRSDRVISDT